jgi:hypothetical protein
MPSRCIFFERLESLIDVVVADENLQAVLPLPDPPQMKNAANVAQRLTTSIPFAVEGGGSLAKAG